MQFDMVIKVFQTVKLYKLIFNNMIGATFRIYVWNNGIEFKK